MKGVKKLGVRLCNWLSAEQGQALWQAPDPDRLKGKRDRALLAVLLSCGLRRHELAELSIDHLQQREGHWAIVDSSGNAGHVQTVPVPDCVHGLGDGWTKSAGIESGRLFRRVSSAGRARGEGVTEKALWHVVKEFAAKNWRSQTSAARSEAKLCPALSRYRRRTRADPVSPGSRLDPDHRALSRLHSADIIGGER